MNRQYFLAQFVAALLIALPVYAQVGDPPDSCSCIEEDLEEYCTYVGDCRCDDACDAYEAGCDDFDHSPDNSWEKHCPNRKDCDEKPEVSPAGQKELKSAPQF